MKKLRGVYFGAKEAFRTPHLLVLQPTDPIQDEDTSTSETALTQKSLPDKILHSPKATCTHAGTPEHQRNTPLARTVIAT